MTRAVPDISPPLPLPGDPYVGPTVAPPADPSAAVLSARSLTKSFRMGDSTVGVLRQLDLDVRPGEFVAIEGRSGSGKSTLLHVLAGLDSADDGAVLINGQQIGTGGWSLTDHRLAALRNRQFGFVFQFYHLLPELTVLQNAQLASMIQFSWLGFRRRRAELRARAIDLLTRFGLEHRLDHRPAQLSGGERQRVAIARALMNDPAIVFADEPTGNLDAETGRQIMDVLEGLHRERGQTIVMVTHDRSLAREADRVLVLRDGRLEAIANPT